MKTRYDEYDAMQTLCNDLQGIMLSIIYKIKEKNLNAKKFRNILNESKLAYIYIRVEAKGIDA